MSRGRPKGYSPYIEINYEELGDWLGRKSKVVVCKKWLDSITEQGYTSEVPSIPIKQSEPILEPIDSKVIDIEEIESPKIEYKITKFN